MTAAEKLIVERLSLVSQANGGPAVNSADYETWLDGEGAGDAERCHRAVVTLVGASAADHAEGLARLPDLVAYALKQGPRNVGGIDLHHVLINHNAPALAYVC